jgi:phage terminase large subunit-like protein
MNDSSALDLIASLVLQSGARWGEVAEPFQWGDARAVLSIKPRSPRLHFLTRPRGASKTEDLGGVAIAALLTQLPQSSRSFGFAADREQAGLLIDSVRGFVQRTPGLSGALRVDSWKVTAMRSGATFQIMASDDASAWGLRPHFIVVDELAQWPSTPGPRRLWTAIFSALPKIPGSRLVGLTSAGEPGHWSYKILKDAKQDLRWRVHEVPGPCPWIPKADLDVQRRALTEWEYARLHLNVWAEGDEHLTTVEDLQACATLAGPLEPVPGKQYCIGIDLGLKTDRTAVAIVHADPRPEAQPGEAAVKITLDRMGVWAGTHQHAVSLEEVEAWVLEAKEHYNHAPIVADPWQSAMLCQRLRQRGVAVHEFAFSQQSVGRLAQSLYALLRDRALVLPRDEDLLAELATVKIKETGPGVFRLDHDPSKHDDRAIAIALAAMPLLNAANKPRARVGAYRFTYGSRRYGTHSGRDSFGRVLREWR